MASPTPTFTMFFALLKARVAFAQWGVEQGHRTLSEAMAPVLVYLQCGSTRDSATDHRRFVVGDSDSNRIVVHSVEECVSKAVSVNHDYIAFGCPRTTKGGWNCWFGSSVNTPFQSLDDSECMGAPYMNIGNGASNGHCNGFPAGTYTTTYNDETWPLGGWHRQAIFRIFQTPAPVSYLQCASTVNSGRRRFVLGESLSNRIYVKSIEECVNKAVSFNHDYIGFECPWTLNGGEWECWFGSSLNTPFPMLADDECVGIVSTDIGNGASNGHCNGFPAGTYTTMYNGQRFPLGGWHRQAIFRIFQTPAPTPAPTAATAAPMLCICTGGTPAVGEHCTTPGANMCTSCDDGWNKDTEAHVGTCHFDYDFCNDTSRFNDSEELGRCYTEIGHTVGTGNIQVMKEWSGTDTTSWEVCEGSEASVEVCTKEKLDLPVVSAEVTGCASPPISIDICSFKTRAQSETQSRAVTVSIVGVRAHAVFACLKGRHYRIEDAGSEFVSYDGNNALFCARGLAEQDKGCPGVPCIGNRVHSPGSTLGLGTTGNVANGSCRSGGSIIIAAWVAVCGWACSAVGSRP